MTTKEKLVDEINSCLKETIPLIESLQEKNKDKNYSFHLEYQKWYSKAIKIIAFLAPDRFTEFKAYYEVDPKRKSLGYGTYVIQDYIKGVAPSSYTYSDFNTKGEALKNLYNQYTILGAIAPRVNSILADIQSALYIELQDLELDTAKSLLKVNVRSAGVIAGVILEGYLSKILNKHNLKSQKKNPTLSEFNEILKTNNVYDLSVWRKISYLGDIRNNCAHKNEKEPTKEQVEELIEGTNWVSKNVF